MELGIGIIGIIAVLGAFASNCVAAISSDLQIEYLKYATDHSPTFYLSDKTIFSTGNFITQANTFIESGSKGSWSFEPDPFRFTFTLGEQENTMIFLGREHPLNFTRGYAVETYTALGSVWAQNQLEALDPRVSGWIGAGIVQNVSEEWKITAMYSPVFLPTFGPSLGFTDRGELNPAPFTRLPPASAVTSGVTVPIRYQLRVNQISELLLQHQAFFGVNFHNPDVVFDAYTFTAPKPDVVPLTDAKLSVNDDTVNAKVTIAPQFPREYWAGLRWYFKNLPLTPALEVVQNLLDYPTHVASLTAYFDTPQFNPFTVKRPAKAAFGLLSHFQRDFSGPNMSDFLLFLKLPVTITDQLTFRTLIQTTMLSMRQSFYWMNELEYEFLSGLSVVAQVRLLAGQDHSYFGDWRDQDSYSAGIKWVW